MLIPVSLSELQRNGFYNEYKACFVEKALWNPKYVLFFFPPTQPNADCLDDITPDFEGSVGPPTNQITGASDVTVNESSVGVDPIVRSVGLLQVIQDADVLPQVGEVSYTASSEYTSLTSRINKNIWAVRISFLYYRLIIYAYNF